MCESVPRECLPPTPSSAAGGGAHAGDTAAGRLPRRQVLMGLGGLFLAGCMPTSSAVRAHDAMAAAPAATPDPRAGRRRYAPAPDYRIVRRATWGAESLKDNHDPMARITRITVHHTAEIAGMQERADADLVKGIQDFHRNKRGWADIGYHWVIGRDGTVYEGRSLAVQGAHAGGGNNVENLGISVIGDFSTAMPPTPAVRTLTLFLRAQQERYRVPMAEVFGHREFKATACPGDALFSWLETYRASA